jgi:hypothetical protein
MKASHNRELALLICLLILFALIFLLAFVNLKRGVAVFNLGIPYVIEDLLIIILSILSIGKIAWIIAEH